MSAPAVAPRERRVRVRRPSPVTPPANVPPAVAEVLRSPGPGEPIAPTLRERVGGALGADLEPVRVHGDARARLAAERLGARAFSFAGRIFLGRGARASDPELIAHESAHVIQQQAAPALLLHGGTRAGALESEARAAGQAVAGGGTPAPIAGRTAPVIQREEEGWLEAGAWSLVRRVSPDLEPILRQGLLAWLRERIASALQNLFETITAPIRTAWEFVGTLRSHFTDLVAWMRTAASRIAAGDCGAIAEAAERIQEVVSGLASPVIDRVKAAASRVGDFFTGLWERFGAPAWDWLRRMGGAVWDRIQGMAAWLWEKTQPVREWLSDAWRWAKRKLGVGDDAEGQNGLLQWVQRKAGEAWDWLKEKLGPYKRQLMVVGGVLVALSPAGPLIALGAGVYGLIRGVRWLAANMRRRGAVLEQRGFLEGTIIPGIHGAVSAVSAALQRAAAWVSEKLGSIAGGLGRAVGAVGESFLRFAVGIVEWLLEKFQALANWATEQVSRLAGLVESGLARLKEWLEPVLGVLRGIGRVIENVLHVVQLVATRVWNAIPACLRDPIVNFFTQQILSRIPIFGALVSQPDLWPRIRATALAVIRRVFTGFDLAGAALLVFQFLLDLLNVPIALVRSIFTKARSALDAILSNPVGFLRNILAALKDGFDRFLGNFLRHLVDGLINWLTSQAGDAGVQVPTTWTFGSIFRFVVDILGITLDRVLRILERKLPPGVVARLRSVIRVMTGAWEFVSVLFTEGPAGLWRMLQERAQELWNQAIEAISNFMAMNVITRAAAKLAAMLVPTGVTNIVLGLISLYQAIQSAIEWARQILEIVDRWFDNLIALAQGAVGGIGEAFERLLVRALPVAIGFLANQVNLGRLGRRLREMIDRLQARVEGWIERLVDRALAVGRAVIDRIMSAVTRRDQRTPEEQATAAATAVREAQGLLQAPNATHETVSDGLPAIRQRHRLRALDLVVTSQDDARETVYVQALVNPAPKTTTVTIVKGLRPAELIGKPTPRLDELAQYPEEAARRVHFIYVRAYRALTDKSFYWNVVDYVEQRAARKLGRRAETSAVAALNALDPALAAQVNRRLIRILLPRAGGFVNRQADPRIPDFINPGVCVGDVKRTQSLSRDPQMLDDVRIALGQARFDDETAPIPVATRGVHLIVRGPADDLPDPAGTHISAPLKAMVIGTGGKIWPIL